MQNTKAQDLQHQVDAIRTQIKDMQKILLALANKVYEVREIIDEYQSKNQK